MGVKTGPGLPFPNFSVATKSPCFSSFYLGARSDRQIIRSFPLLTPGGAIRINLPSSAGGTRVIMTLSPCPAIEDDTGPFFPLYSCFTTDKLKEETASPSSHKDNYSRRLMTAFTLSDMIRRIRVFFFSARPGWRSRRLFFPNYVTKPFSTPELFIFFACSPTECKGSGAFSFLSSISKGRESRLTTVA